MHELKITKRDHPLSTAELKTSTLSLIGKTKDFEVMEHFIKKNRMFVIYPASEISVEYYYILEGIIYSEDLSMTLSKGDSIYYDTLTETKNFKALTDVRILYFINKSIFHEISDEMKALREIMKSVDDKDKYTKQHCNRVQELSFKIAKQMNLKGDTLEGIQFSSIFHDLGKVEIPNEILNKPGKLTDEEYEIIKTHSYHGSQIIKSLYFKNLEKIVLQHHERVDGTGYPNGLKGDEICLEAAIISVADTYDAMTSDRPYRKALSKDVALDEIKRLKGKHFKEEVVEAFLEVIDKEID